MVAVRDGYTGEVIAHLNLLPITGNLYGEFHAGVRGDTDIPIAQISRYDEAGLYLLYFCSVAVHPGYRQSEAFRLMTREYLRRFHALAERGIFVTNIIADAVTEKGERICRMFGLAPGNISEHGSRIYTATSLEFLEAIGRYAKCTGLKAAYRRRFGADSPPGMRESLAGAIYGFERRFRKKGRLMRQTRPAGLARTRRREH